MYQVADTKNVGECTMYQVIDTMYQSRDTSNDDDCRMYQAVDTKNISNYSPRNSNCSLCNANCSPRSDWVLQGTRGKKKKGRPFAPLLSQFHAKNGRVGSRIHNSSCRVLALSLRTLSNKGRRLYKVRLDPLQIRPHLERKLD